MNKLILAVFVVGLACVNASGIGLGLVAPSASAVLAGPSGIVRAGPGGIAIAGPALAASPLALAAGGALLAIPPGSGLEGQWIPDINEKLHDDGSYRPGLGEKW